jgi:hypothetical protein
MTGTHSDIDLRTALELARPLADDLFEAYRKWVHPYACGGGLPVPAEDVIALAVELMKDRRLEWWNEAGAAAEEVKPW